jgi:hypothetical protein
MVVARPRRLSPAAKDVVGAETISALRNRTSEVVRGAVIYSNRTTTSTTGAISALNIRTRALNPFIGTTFLGLF